MSLQFPSMKRTKNMAGYRGWGVTEIRGFSRGSSDIPDFVAPKICLILKVYFQITQINGIQILAYIYTRMK